MLIATQKGMEDIENVSAVQKACQAVEMPTFSSLSATPDLQTLRQQYARFLLCVKNRC